MKFSFSLLLASSLAMAMTGNIAMADPLDVCRERVRLEVTRAHHQSEALARAQIYRGLAAQVRALNRLHRSLTRAGANQTTTAQGLTGFSPVAQRIVERSTLAFATVYCGPNERASEVNGVWSCIDTAGIGQDPVMGRELFVKDGFAYACSQYISRSFDERPPNHTFDIRSCSQLNLDTGMITGSQPMDSVNPNIVNESVYAYVDEVDLSQSIEPLIATAQESSCQ